MQKNQFQQFELEVQIEIPVFCEFKNKSLYYYVEICSSIKLRTCKAGIKKEVIYLVGEPCFLSGLLCHK